MRWPDLKAQINSVIAAKRTPFRIPSVLLPNLDFCWIQGCKFLRTTPPIFVPRASCISSHLWATHFSVFREQNECLINNAYKEKEVVIRLKNHYFIYVFTYLFKDLCNFFWLLLGSKNRNSGQFVADSEKKELNHLVSY